METFEGTNPFLEEPTALRFVGRTFYEQARQVSVPVVVQYVEGGEYKPLFVAPASRLNSLTMGGPSRTVAGRPSQLFRRKRARREHSFTTEPALAIA